MLYKKNRKINVNLLDLVLNDLKLNLIFNFVFKILRFVFLKINENQDLTFQRLLKLLRFNTN